MDAGGSPQTGDDFLVAGRTLPARVLVFTLLSTWIGSGSLFAGAGLGYRGGFSGAVAVGGRVGRDRADVSASRRASGASRSTPCPTSSSCATVRRRGVLGTITTVLAYTTIAAYQFRGGGRLLNLVSGIDPRTGALITAAFCVCYTALAGMLSVAYLDVGNGLMMIVGVGVSIVYLAGHAGGFGGAVGALRADQLTLFGTLSPIDALALFLPTMFLLLGEANMYQKFFSARDERAARAAVAGWILGTIAARDDDRLGRDPRQRGRARARPPAVGDDRRAGRARRAARRRSACCCSPVPRRSSSRPPTAVC